MESETLILADGLIPSSSTICENVARSQERWYDNHDGLINRFDALEEFERGDKQPKFTRTHHCESASKGRWSSEKASNREQTEANT